MNIVGNVRFEKVVSSRETGEIDVEINHSVWWHTSKRSGNIVSKGVRHRKKIGKEEQKKKKKGTT